jgi:gliding motility-associated-like protein
VKFVVHHIAALFVLLITGGQLFATHNIAGEITIRCIGSNQYEATVTTYTNSASPADRCELVVDWGDGTERLANRTLGPIGSCPSPATMGIPLGVNYPNTQVNYYKSVHTYSGAGTYNVSIKDPNRVAGILNIPNSVNVPFYLQTTITVDPFIGCNSTPTLTNIPLDKACRGKCFYHNPGAIDPDGDSLSYKIGACLDTNGLPIGGYVTPDIAGGGLMQIDAVTGDLSWCSPQVAGKYNICIYIEEWKKLPNGNRVKVSTIIRDMSIDVLNDCNNDNPDIDEIPDLCVDAGTLINFSFVTSDPNADLVRIQGYGGPFLENPAASISPNNNFNNTPYATIFNWQTTCENIRVQPWIVTMKATDDDPTVPLLDIETFKITVVSPGPPALFVDPQGSQMNVHWTPNPCNPVSNPVKGYKIYRRNGPSGWTPAQCETGVPAYTGFQLIGTLNAGINDTVFTDNNNGGGLIPGIDYCYRVCAVFLDGAESYASPEVCNELKRDVPVITNVDVQSTGGNDTIYLRWANALANGIDFDTLVNPPPYQIIIERNSGFLIGTSPQLVTTLTASSFATLPDSFVDVALNTAGTPYTYRLGFFSNNGSFFIGNSQPASSVYLYTQPADNSVILTWQDSTPWTNYEYAIFRQNNTTLAWDSIGLSVTNTYTDTGLVNGVQYCYFVKAHGSYFNATLPSMLLNRSQRKCDTPQDLTAPCPPVLAINSDCYIGLNQLVWTNPNNMSTCSTDDVVSYNIWYSATDTSDLAIIATIIVSTDTTLIFDNLFSVAGCYAVTALDTFGNQSVLSNVICLENCPTYELPNVFTPNGDNINDFFIPFPYRQVESIDLKIYDRWGVLVFETTDPDVMWDGRDRNSGKLCTDGVYYYTCQVNEIRLQGIVPRQLKGFVHLFGKDSRTF